MEKVYVEVIEAEQVTDEILEAAQEISDGWYADSRIDWTDFLDRLDGTHYDSLNGYLDLGSDMASPAIKRIKAHIRAYRKL